MDWDLLVDSPWKLSVFNDEEGIRLGYLNFNTFWEADRIRMAIEELGYTTQLKTAIKSYGGLD